MMKMSSVLHDRNRSGLGAGRRVGSGSRIIGLPMMMITMNRKEEVRLIWGESKGGFGCAELVLKTAPK